MHSSGVSSSPSADCKIFQCSKFKWHHFILRVLIFQNLSEWKHDHWKLINQSDRRVRHGHLVKMISSKHLFKQLVCHFLRLGWMTGKSLKNFHNVTSNQHNILAYCGRLRWEFALTYCGFSHIFYTTSLNYTWMCTWQQLNLQSVIFTIL